MGLTEFMNFLFTNPLSHNYYIASIIILMISTGHIKSSVIVDLISSLLTSSFYQVIEWPMKLMIFIYAVIPTIRFYGFKYKFAVLFLVVDLLLNTFLDAQVPLTSPMACYDDDEECCPFISFIEYEDRMTPADVWLEYLSRAIVAFYICCSIYVIVGKKAEILEYILLGFRFLSANFIVVLAVINTFLFLIQFKLQEITIFTLVVYMSCKLVFESWFPYPTRNSLIADTQIVNAKMQGRVTSKGAVQDAVGSETVTEQSQASDGDTKDKPDDNQNEDSDDDAGENAEAEAGGDSDKNPDDSPDGNADDSDDNSDDSDDDPDENDDDEDSDDGDEDDEEDEDDEDDDDPERVPDVVDEDVDDDERCSLM